MELLCHCDHCQNNTCVTNENGLCWAELKLDQNNQIVKTANCFYKESKLLQNLICDHTSTKTTQSITRCCNSANYCNRKEDFLPPYNEAKKLLLEYNNQQNNSFNLFNLYHNANAYMILNVYSLIFILVVIVLVLLTFTFFRKRRETNSESSSITECAITSSEMAAADTNSLESREPLINVKTFNHPSINLMHNPGQALIHPDPNRGPFMSGETVNSNTLASFQMSIGSGDRLGRIRETSSPSAAGQPIRPETSSGSGAGQPYLSQRSISHDIELVEVVGRGYFGVVWRGQYKGEMVAVKIFSAAAESSWRREAEIYQTTMLRHKNILGFIAADKKDDLFMTGYWLVTDYYPLGSLYDFINARTMSMTDAVRMGFSIANGLSHLHVEIFGTQGKPAIAHRDVKSKNILVKSDGSCCIADLGMAARFNSNTGIVDVPANSRVGTRRYLAPEILDGKLNMMDFEAVKAADVYALGLVLWELLRRTCYVQSPSTSTDVGPSSDEPMPSTSRAEIEQRDRSPPPSAEYPSSDELTKPFIRGSDSREYEFEGENSPAAFYESLDISIEDMKSELALASDNYTPPYHDYVSTEPTMEEMRVVVCIKKIRPQTSYRWTKFAPMRDYATLMRECWYEKPQARLSALRVRKTLGDIAKHYFNSNMDCD